ncbi:nitrogen regulation protein NR(II) [Alteromonadaceae bacterium M269]|nr:nitrogen regulation protein NR(II) [Alteromonadaceae bacterium M269]
MVRNETKAAVQTVFFDSLFSHISTGVLLLDTELRIQYANLAAESIFEQSINQLRNEVFDEHWINAESQRQRFLTLIRTKDGFSDSEVQMLFVDGRHALVDLVASSFINDGKHYVLLEIRPIENQKRISEETHQWAQQQAARELVRGLAHEIKNPLGGIRGAAQLLEKELKQSELQEFTQMIIDQSDRLRNLVDRLLGPNTPPRFAWRNLHQILEKIRTLIHYDSAQKVKVERDYDPSIPDLWLDDDKIQQAVLNITRNAAQAINWQGEITFITRVKRQCTIHGRQFPLVAVIKIIDNGPGIPDEIRDTIFYPMVTGKQDGTGLGLSIAQSLIEHHKGKIELDSWPGHTEFCIYLPIERKEPTK